MKKLVFLLSFILLIMGTSVISSSCSPKTGCEINEQAHVKLNKKGELPTKRGKSNLFRKKHQRKGY